LRNYSLCTGGTQLGYMAPDSSGVGPMTCSIPCPDPNIFGEMDHKLA